MKDKIVLQLRSFVINV